MSSISSDQMNSGYKEGTCPVRADASADSHDKSENTKQPSRFPINLKYILKTYGFAKLLQFGTSLMGGMLTLAVTQQDKAKVMDLPMHWRLEVLACVLFISALFALLIFFAHFWKLTYQCPFEFHKVDLFISSVFVVAFGVLAGLVFEAAAYYHENYPDWKGIQAYDSSFMAIFCGSTYVFGVVSLIREIRGNGQFLSRRLYNEHDRDEQVVVVVDGWEVFLRAENPPKWTTAYEEAQAKRAEEGGQGDATTTQPARVEVCPSLY